MARKTTTPDKTSIAAEKKPLDLTTAKVADGQVRAPTSVYEMVGIPTDNYGKLSEDQYRRQIEGMSLWELQAHAQKLGIQPNRNRELMLDRLHREYLKAKARYSSDTIHGGRMAEQAPSEVRDETLRILSRGR